MLFWTVAAAVVLLVLGGYAVSLHRKVKGREKQQAVWRAELEDYMDERRSYMTKSIGIIASAMIEGQMTTAECCMRISSLLKKLGDMAYQKRFAVIHEVAAGVDHIPIMEEWRALAFKQRMVYLKEIDAIENQYREFVMDSCKSIKNEGIDKRINADQAPDPVSIYDPQ